MNKTNDEEPLVIDNSVINAPSYFEIFECGKNFLNNLDATYEQACMETSQKKWYTTVIRYGQVCMLEKDAKYYKELSNTITTFNDNNNTLLSNMNI